MAGTFAVLAGPERLGGCCKTYPLCNAFSALKCNALTSEVAWAFGFGGSSATGTVFGSPDCGVGTSETERQGVTILRQSRRLSDCWKYDNVHRAAFRRLSSLDAATTLGDLSGGGMSLEPLKGDRVGQHSIRINLQWRICFVWQNGNAAEVEIADYH